MVLPPPAPIPSASPSAAPYRAQIESLNQQLGHLVAANQQLNAKLTKANGELLGAAEDHKRGMEAIRLQWKNERKEWMDGCDAVQVVHNVSNLKLRCVLDSERLARCDAAAELRLQKVASVMRDHKLVLFQAKEFELEQQVAALEEELTFHKGENSREKHNLIAEYENTIDELKENLSRYVISIQSKSNEIEALKKFKKDLKIQFEGLNSRYDALLQSNDDQAHTIDRYKEELAAKTQAYEADLKNRDSELKKIKKVEEREKAQDSSLVKAKVDLELEVRRLEQDLERYQEQMRTAAQELKKEKKRSASLERETKELQENLEEIRKDMHEAQQESEGLKSRLKSTKNELKAAQAEIRALQTMQEEVDVPQTAKKLSKVPKATKAKGREESEEPEEIDIQGVESGSSRHSASPPPETVRTKKPGIKSTKSTGATSERIAPKAVAKHSKLKTVAPQQSSRGQPATRKTEDSTVAIKQTKAKKARTAAGAGQKSSLPQDREDREGSDNEDVDVPVIKKKRKLNALLGVGKPQWDLQGMASGGNDFNIPSIVSPLKQLQVPSRSIFSKSPSTLFP